jgi:hypothetical protein
MLIEPPLQRLDSIVIIAARFSIGCENYRRNPVSWTRQIALQLKNPVPLVPRLCLVTHIQRLRLAQTHQQTLD